MNLDKITLVEREAFNLSYNLADAQVYLPLGRVLESHLQNQLPHLLQEAGAIHINQLKTTFLTTFYKNYNMPSQVAEISTLFCYSATIGIEVCANLIRTSSRFARKNVGLIHPTFDATYYILKRHKANVVPVSEDDLKADNLGDLLAKQRLEVLFLTLPNNPTGEVLSKKDFLKVCQVCKSLNILLVIDACFRFYWVQEVYDQYALLVETGVEFVIIEDTGKIFNILDIKLGFMRYRTKIDKEIETIHLDFLLNVSKVPLIVLQQLLEKSATLDYRQKLLAVLEHNRKQLVASGFTILNNVNVSVSLVELTGTIDSKELEQNLTSHNVAVLSPQGYFWDNPAEGSNKLRIALARDPEYFAAGISKVCRLLAPR